MIIPPYTTFIQSILHQLASPINNLFTAQMVWSLLVNKNLDVFSPSNHHTYWAVFSSASASSTLVANFNASGMNIDCICEIYKYT